MAGVLIPGLIRLTLILQDSSPRFDYYISEKFAPNGTDFLKLTRVCQTALYHKWHGYVPPGTCTLIPLPDDMITSNEYGCRHIALCPTMRVPEDVTWDKEVVYNCMWSLLNALHAHNTQANESAIIRKVLMSGFATGVGKVSAERCAKQMALAVKHFEEAKSQPAKWGALEWADAEPLAGEVIVICRSQGTPENTEITRSTCRSISGTICDTIKM
jgi:O-acetyl-ADP-ribose deacetylase (regulator of RNase III)